MGGVIFYSGRVNPHILFNVYYKKYGIKPKRIFPSGGNANDWCSIVLPMHADDFINISFNELRGVLEKAKLYTSDECKIPGMPKEQ